MCFRYISLHTIKRSVFVSNENFQYLTTSKISKKIQYFYNMTFSNLFTVFVFKLIFAHFLLQYIELANKSFLLFCVFHFCCCCLFLFLVCYRILIPNVRGIYDFWWMLTTTKEVLVGFEQFCIRHAIFFFVSSAESNCWTLFFRNEQRKRNMRR